MNFPYDARVDLPDPPDYTDMSDADLFARIRRQDLVACSVYYARHGAVIYGRLLALLGDEQLAQQTLETLFLEVWKHCRELSDLGPAVTDTLVDRSAALAVAVLADRVKSGAGEALPASEEHAALIARCRELNEPDLTDGVVRQCVESIVADAPPVTPPPDARRRLAVRLGHPDVEGAADRYARRWWWGVLLAGVIAAAGIVAVAWLLRPYG